jgi:hypothetical protein
VFIGDEAIRPRALQVVAQLVGLAIAVSASAFAVAAENWGTRLVGIVGAVVGIALAGGVLYLRVKRADMGIIDDIGYTFMPPCRVVLKKHEMSRLTILVPHVVNKDGESVSRLWFLALCPLTPRGSQKAERIVDTLNAWLGEAAPLVASVEKFHSDLETQLGTDIEMRLEGTLGILGVETARGGVTILASFGIEAGRAVVLVTIMDVDVRYDDDGDELGVLDPTTAVDSIAAWFDAQGGVPR